MAVDKMLENAIGFTTHKKDPNAVADNAGPDQPGH